MTMNGIFFAQKVLQSSLLSDRNRFFLNQCKKSILFDTCVIIFFGVTGDPFPPNKAKNEASVTTPQIDPNNKSRLNPPNDLKKAKVVFLRPSEESLITWDYNILINGKSVGKIEDEYIASYEIPAGENTITLSGALYEFPVLKIKGNSGSTHYICVGREGNGYTGYIGTLEPLETQEGERLCTMLRKENGDYEPLSKKRDNLNRASSSIIKRR